jgi:pantetheine-phosphate adenylyltransferase
MVETHRTAVYTGSFDPVTLGHQSVIQRSAKLFDEVVVAVGVNVEKKMFFSTAERVQLLQTVTDSIDNVRVTTFDGLAVDYVRSIGARVMIRGLRPLTDTAGEFTMMMANRQLDSEIETVFLMSDESLTHVSSSLIKQIAPLADDDKLARFVPHQVIPAIREKFGTR